MKKSIKATIISVFCIMFAAAALFMLAPRTEADSQSELKAAKEQLAQIKKKQEALEDALKKAKSDKESKIEAKILMEEQLQSTKDEISALNKVLYQLEDKLEKKNSELDKASKNYNEYMEKFKSRARASYEAGDISYIEVLLTSKDLSEMMTKVDLITEVAEYDRNLLKKLKSEISIIEELRNDIAQQTNEQKEAVDSLASAKSRQQSQINQIDSAISDLKSDEASLIAEQEKYDKLEEALDKKISSLASTSTSYSGDELCWPVPGYSRISSGYGWRTLYGKRNFHSAIDIPAPKGTPIVAAEAGTVIYAQWTDTGGGYKIVVDHGSQLVTHYNHMSSFAVSKGDKVKKGQVIGYVGSTGNSTGNHLDFKIIYKGETYNPSLYVNPSNSKPQKSIHSLIG